jgi:hypothetical protein
MSDLPHLDLMNTFNAAIGGLRKYSGKTLSTTTKNGLIAFHKDYRSTKLPIYFDNLNVLARKKFVDHIYELQDGFEQADLDFLIREMEQLLVHMWRADQIWYESVKAKKAKVGVTKQNALAAAILAYKR